MNTKIAFFILILLLFTSLGRGNTNNIAKSASVKDKDAVWYAYNSGHFRFLIPYYWEIIPEKKINQYKDILQQNFPNRAPPNYVVGVQRKALKTFSLPYFLIEIEERPMPTPEEVEAERASYQSSVRRAYSGLHKKGLFGEVKAMPATYDSERHIIFGYSHMMRAADKQRLTSITSIYPCRYGFVRFHFFLPQEKETNYMPAVETVITSVTFNAGYGYSQQEAQTGTVSKKFRVGLGIFIITLATIWITMRFFSRRV